jgi:anti-anti-sigma factor
MADIKYTFSDLIGVDNVTPIKVITLEGQLDESNVDEFAPKVYELINATPAGTSYILDVENISYINSKSIGYISDWYSQIISKQGKLVIAKPASNIKDILNVVGLDKVIPLAQTLEEAKSHI